MADNQYVNRVEFGDQVVMDISDTTASASDVLSGKKLYTSSGAPATGTLVPGTITEVQANGTSVATSGIANIPAASLSEFGVTKLNNTVSSTSITEAATAAVVKRLNDNTINSTMSSTMQNVDVLALNPGAYRYHSNCTNKPTTDSGFIQLFYRDDTTKLAIANTSSGRMFTNVMIDGSWTGWRELAQNSNSEFHPALNSATVSTAILDGIRYGNVCKITFNINVKVSGSGWVTVATIPAGYTPAIRQYGVCAVDSTVSAGEGKIAEVRVTTDNELQIYVPIAKAYWGGIEYICS
ncbi:MAG: tail fiber protein [Clostridium sp.]|nr:tail fiber protein [Clostridium sp.]